MARAQIKPRPRSDRGNFTTTIKNTDLSQRETLEEIIINMATAIGAKEIYKQQIPEEATSMKFKHTDVAAIKAPRTQYLNFLAYLKSPNNRFKSFAPLTGTG